MSEITEILVKDHYDPKKMHSLLVHEGESLLQVIKHFAEDPCLRGIFVIDDKELFKGVITRYDLINWAKYKLGAGKNADLISMEDIDRYVYSLTVKDIVSRYSYRAYATPEDTLVAALELMISEDLITIPVIDETKKVLGDLTLSEILNEVIQEIQ